MRFQSLIGSIQNKAVLVCTILKASFQSLIGSIQNCPKLRYSMFRFWIFQSLIGSIQNMVIEGLLALTNQFQSLIGSIQNKARRFDIAAPTKFQSLIGSIQNRTEPALLIKNKRISIPHRFDSKLCSRYNLQQFWYPFQSLIGSIQNYEKTGSQTIAGNPFQSPIGSIQNPESRLRNHSRYCISIPHRFDSKRKMWAVMFACIIHFNPS